ncbi:MAG: hypothetical protein MI975_25335 [Cytophagales bacterium]|nr:hypothetical protein [Cytophagales bacterium]
MKTTIQKLARFTRYFFAFSFMLIMANLAFAQGDTSSMNFSDYFADFATFVLLIPIVVEFIKKLIPEDSPSLAIQIASWVTGLILAMLAWILKLGFFADILEWWQALIIGAGASLAANGVFDTGLITWIFSLVGIRTKN